MSRRVASRRVAGRKTDRVEFLDGAVLRFRTEGRGARRTTVVVRQGTYTDDELRLHYRRHCLQAGAPFDEVLFADLQRWLETGQSAYADGTDGMDGMDGMDPGQEHTGAGWEDEE